MAFFLGVDTASVRKIQFLKTHMLCFSNQLLPGTCIPFRMVLHVHNICLGPTSRMQESQVELQHLIPGVEL